MTPAGVLNEARALRLVLASLRADAFARAAKRKATE